MSKALLNVKKHGGIANKLPKGSCRVSSLVGAKSLEDLYRQVLQERISYTTI